MSSNQAYHETRVLSIMVILTRGHYRKLLGDSLGFSAWRLTALFIKDPSELESRQRYNQGFHFCASRYPCPFKVSQWIIRVRIKAILGPSWENLLGVRPQGYNPGIFLQSSSKRKTLRYLNDFGRHDVHVLLPEVVGVVAHLHKRRHGKTMLQSLSQEYKYKKIIIHISIAGECAGASYRSTKRMN